MAKIELYPELYSAVRDRFSGEERVVSNADLQCEVRFFRT